MDININLQPIEEFISLPCSTQESVEAKIEPYSDEITVEISEFPSYIKTLLEANSVIIKASISLSVVPQRLIVNTDSLLCVNIDDMILGDLDTEQEEIYYSI